MMERSRKKAYTQQTASKNSEEEKKRKKIIIAYSPIELKVAISDNEKGRRRTRQGL